MTDLYATYTAKKPIYNRLFKARLSIGLLLVMIPSVSPAQENQGLLTLEDSIRRVAEIAPEMKAANAKIGMQHGKWELADAWPNPSISIVADDTLKRDVGGRGYNVTEFSISQPLPIGRLAYQRRQAKAGIAKAEMQYHNQQLLLEYKVALLFHTLQMKEAQLKQAKTRLQQASHYQSGDRKQHQGDPLIRYLTPLEKMRLDIVLQAAKQAVGVAEGEFNDTASSFKSLLGIPTGQSLRLKPLIPVLKPKELNYLEKKLQAHPALEAAEQQIISAQAGVDVAKWQRISDPTLTFFRRNNFLANRQLSNGIMLSVEVPLWGQNNGAIIRARYAVDQAQAELHIKQRDLQSSLHNSYLHLSHLIEQAEHYRTKLLRPAQQVFKLTQKGFDAGELNILTLIDANNTYFDAQARYLALLQKGWLALAVLRRAAGITLLSSNVKTDFSVVK